MKYRAYNAYLCLVPDRVGLPRMSGVPLPQDRPVFVKPTNRSQNVIARRAIVSWPKIRNAPTARLSSTKKQSSMRFVDRPTVVIQSGLTPRAQLRAVAQTMRRLKQSSTGFVFNRVSIRRGRPWIHRSVRDLEPCLGLPRVSPQIRPSEARQNQTAQELSAVTKPELVKPPASAVSADASPQPAASQQLTANPSSVAPPISTVAVDTESAPSARVARGRGEPQRPTSASRTPRSSAAHPAAPPAASRPAPAPEPTLPAGAPEPSESFLAVPPSPYHPPPSNDAARVDQFDSAPAEYPSSRLSGLRNLLVSLGRRSLTQNNELPEESDPGIEPRFERATVRPAFQDSIAPASGAPENGDPTRLTTEPEFLPPRNIAEAENEKEKEAVRPTPPRRDTPEGEEIQTLPSWRGQYRKRRYLPD